MRILYVEDHPANLFLVQRVARMGNHDIINYTEGQSALDHFEKDKPDLVLMDVQLPGKLTGLDVVKELRARGHRLPIIAVTAYAMMGDRERCLEAGCDAYIAKPMPISDLVDILKKYDPTSSEKPTPAQESPAPATTAASSAPIDEKPAVSPTITQPEPVAATEAVVEKLPAEAMDAKPAAESPALTPAKETPLKEPLSQTDSVKKLEAS
jgi:two-component system cell cycle response regulator DivK